MKNFSKRKFLIYFREKISQKAMQQLISLCEEDEVGDEFFNKVLKDNIVPSSRYEDFCYFVSDVFNDDYKLYKKGEKYLLIYMGSIYLYCFSKDSEGGAFVDVNSFYIRKIISILQEFNDVKGAELFYEFLENVIPQDENSEYFFTLGKLFILRIFEINKDAVGIIFERLEKLSKKLDSLSFVTDSVSCPEAYEGMNESLPIPFFMIGYDKEKILLPRR